MHLSFWERDTWLSNVDYTIVGSGIVGLNTALRLRQRFPQSKILVLEKGALPQGASTKNAGFACFGSLSEIIDDLETQSEQDVIDLIQKRWNGLKLLRKTLGDEAIDYKSFGGYELFLKDNNSFDNCLGKMSYINDLLQPIFNKDVFSVKNNTFNFGQINNQLLFNPFEAQIDTGKMMHALIKKATNANILIINNQTVLEYNSSVDDVEVRLADYSFITKKLLFATNGFAAKLTNNLVHPARAQVLITKPIEGLEINGTFHLDKGYHYFRNIGNRILLGGGRNLDFEGENTSEFGETQLIQNRLDKLLKEVILPNTDYEIDQRWSGIMGLGKSKKPIVTQLSEFVYCGVRLGGMGIAIGSSVGVDLADLV